MKLSVGANSMSSVTVPCEIAEPVMCKGTLLDRLTVEKVKEIKKMHFHRRSLLDLLLDFCLLSKPPRPYVEQHIQSRSALEVA